MTIAASFRHRHSRRAALALLLPALLLLPPLPAPAQGLPDLGSLLGAGGAPAAAGGGAVDPAPGAAPGVDPLALVPLPAFADPLAVPGTLPDCAALPAEEAAKLGCPPAAAAAMAPATAGAGGVSGAGASGAAAGATAGAAGAPAAAAAPPAGTPGTGGFDLGQALGIAPTPGAGGAAGAAATSPGAGQAAGAPADAAGPGGTPAAQAAGAAGAAAAQPGGEAVPGVPAQTQASGPGAGAGAQAGGPAGSAAAGGAAPAIAGGGGGLDLGLALSGKAGGKGAQPAAGDAAAAAQPGPAAAGTPGDAASDTAATGGRKPLPQEDVPGLERRVLTLPGAHLVAQPGEPRGTPLPAFSVRYVYAEAEAGGVTWLEIGRAADGRTEGWIAAPESEDWRTMLVMQYAPRGGRGRVLFFKRRGELEAFVRDPHVIEEARLAYEAIEAGRYDGDYFTAIEPAVDVDPDRPYLMPILAAQEDMFDSLDEVKLLEVAGLNLDAQARAQQDVSETDNRAAPAAHGAMPGFRFGVVFVIDTTITMGRTIAQTREVVGRVIGAFRAAGLEGMADFGLVGYRDNTGPDARIGYVTRIFQPLVPGAPLSEVLANFALMTPSPVSTQGFDEDAFAGLDVALNAIDWDPYDLRMAVLITDAGARRGTDPMAANPGYDTINIVENAERRGVALAVLHLLTPQARRAGNVAPAEALYRQIARTGDVATGKYFGVDTMDDIGFSTQINGFAEGLVRAVQAAAGGGRVQPVAEAASLGDALVNEVFRAQLEYLGAQQGQAAPRFYRAWAADRDLTAPQREALSVKVFLTRQQLSAMMEGAEGILAAYEAQETGGADFFRMMRVFAAQSTVEGAGARPLEEAGALFPAFLSALPYRSDFLALDADTWSAGGPSLQRELTDTLHSKLRAWRDIAAADSGWLDLGADLRAEDVYPVALGLLP